MLYRAVLVAASLVAGVNALWPLPQNFTEGTTTLRLSPGFHITLGSNIGWNAPLDLYDAIGRTQAHLFTDNLGRLIVGRGASDADSLKSAAYLTELQLSLESGAQVNSITTESQKPLTQRDEAYTLTVPSDGSRATITANSTLGLYRGLTTFQQLWYEYHGTIYAYNTPVQIQDKPAYPWRGLLLDTARNYFPVSDILRTLDAMSLVKLNQFHWHVVDSQSFPLEIPGYEELAQYGAYGPDMVYTQGDVQSIVSYAGARGIDVMVEIDTPGHTAVIGEAHPDFVACNEKRPWASNANEPPAGQLRFTNSTIASWTAGIFAELAKVFPSNVISTGGDEINMACYDADEETQLDLNTTGLSFNDALAGFTNLTHGAIEAAGKTPVVWEEQVLDYNLTLSDEIYVLVWISSENAKLVADKGFHVIHTPSDYFYLDCGAGGWVGDNPSGNSWCDPLKTWQHAYTFDPLANLTTDQYDLVLGGQQSLWTEQSGPENLDPIVWPRAASSAEVFWSEPGGNVSAALPRLHDVSFRLRQRGVRSISLQPLWCALRPHECDLSW